MVGAQCAPLRQIHTQILKTLTTKYMYKCHPYLSRKLTCFLACSSVRIFILKTEEECRIQKGGRDGGKHLEWLNAKFKLLSCFMSHPSFSGPKKSHLQAIHSRLYKSVGRRSKTKTKQGKELGRTKGKSLGFCVLMLQNNLSFRSGCFSSRRS